MGRRTYPEIKPDNRQVILEHAGVDGSKEIECAIPITEDIIDELPLRIKKIVDIFNKHNSRITDVLYFVMYDIESNKVRRQVAKYLLGMGCLRVQKSIFLADLSPEKAMKIKEDLTEVQGCYENEDSILVLPVPSDYLKSMKIIGKNISIDLITKCTSTLFF